MGSSSSFLLATALAVLVASPGGAQDGECAPLCPTSPPCGDECSNTPFRPTFCWTTPLGPARADVVTALTNFLYCEGGTYALCFYSGPATPTAPGGRPLPCVLSASGHVADCTCQAYTSGPYFVDINGILNRGAYFETVAKCGADGSGCANLLNCGPNGDVPGCKTRATPPVCTYIAGQSRTDPASSLIPGADLISAFGFTMADQYGLGSKPCEAGLYAGCMTAPCRYPAGVTSVSDGDPVQCECPTYDGVYQVGQDGARCDLEGGHVWSAANVSVTLPAPPKPPAPP